VATVARGANFRRRAHHLRLSSALDIATAVRVVGQWLTDVLETAAHVHFNLALPPLLLP
jgi:hypothetical protein